jgi:hypothetical protein
MIAIPGAIIRLSVGLLGCLWLLGGIYGVAYAGSDHAWAAALGAAVTMLVGYGCAYWAFVRAPWEHKASGIGDGNSD